jgi:hypothetical protein
MYQSEFVPVPRLICSGFQRAGAVLKKPYLGGKTKKKVVEPNICH